MISILEPGGFVDGLVLKPGIYDKRLVVWAEIKQSLTITITVAHAMWTNDRPPGLEFRPNTGIEIP